jgi:hypothetical protein
MATASCCGRDVPLEVIRCVDVHGQLVAVRANHRPESFGLRGLKLEPRRKLLQAKTVGTRQHVVARVECGGALREPALPFGQELESRHAGTCTTVLEEGKEQQSSNDANRGSGSIGAITNACACGRG